MKFNKIFLLSLGLGILTVSCTDFEKVNTNPLNPNAQQKTLDGLASSGLFPPFIQRPIPTGSGVNPANDYQVIQNMSTDNWVGYFSPGRNHWDGGKNQTSYYISDFRVNGTFKTLIQSLINPYFAIKAVTHNTEPGPNGTIIYREIDLVSKSIYSVAQIVKIMGYHRATDMFGPVPYTQMQPGKFQVPYDTQEQVYRAFLKELEEAVATLKEFKSGGADTILTGFDPVYHGDVSKWIKLGNSLMLRLAMRVRYADADLAKQYVNKAYESGVMETFEDGAKLQSDGKFILDNSLTVMNGYGELKMGATLYSYLKGYEDPRMEKYFLKGTHNGKQDFYAVRSGINPNTGSVYSDFSNPNVKRDTPTYWLRASEVKFLLAEAALVDFIAGNAQTFYQEGVAVSFQENGLTKEKATEYLNSSAMPSAYSDPINADYSSEAVSRVDKKWNEGDDLEVKLEKIITQKYIANFPNGFESWSEWRRTGYPRLFKVPFNLSNVSAENISISGSAKGMRRMPFPEEEFRLNSENIMKARTLLEGVDNAATNVWWDKKVKN